MNKYFNNKIVTIFGGTGSFGKAFLKRAIKYSFKEIRIFSRDEKKQDDMRKEFNNPKLSFFLGDVRNYNSINLAMKNVDIVFHAAALKQVPSCEFFPIEAIETNSLGANNVMKAAYENNVSKCILLSTDKAVYPINAMGMTKALMEKLMQANSRILKGRTIFCATRYGNVAGSRGSVIPLFIENIKKNISPTITNKHMTRFLMSLNDSVKLVEYAIKNAKNGDILVLKSPASTINDLSKAIKKIFNKKNLKDKIIGTRHGEKQHEVLVSSEELIKAQEYKSFFRIPMDNRSLNYSKYFIKGNKLLDNNSSYNSNNTKLLKVDEIKKELNSASKNLKLLSKKFKDSNKVVQLIEKNLFEDSPVNINKGNTIKNGINKDLDNFRDVFNNSKMHLQKILYREIENTGITSLKISFNNVFGYYLEVTNAHKDKVPENWIRKQTLVNAERYITEELKEYESKILIAEEKIKEIEIIEYNKVIDKLIPHVGDLQDIAKIIAYSDCLLSFSEISKTYNYSKPIIDESNNFEVIDARHPVIEHTLEESKSYIPNDIKINKTDQQILMITGPNMSGKSAILRQTALISILAQIGSFVPAKKLKMGFFDKIFTRVGASDNISQGESTFMVEMLETSNIIKNADERSFIILDEIGRGTSTFDGLAIAWAIIEKVLRSNKSRTLFATHYHELTEIEKTNSKVRNVSCEIKEWNDEIIYSYKVVEGKSKGSLGIKVAELAGFPGDVIVEAKALLGKLQTKGVNQEDIHLKEEDSLLTDPSSWYIRSEKETLCRFHKDYSLFTINVLFEPLNKIVDYPDALRGLIKSLETFDEDESVYFGGSDKINILLEYLKAQL